MNMNTVALIHNFLGIKNDSSIEEMLNKLQNDFPQKNIESVSPGVTQSVSPATAQASPLQETIDLKSSSDNVVKACVTRKHYSKSDVESVWNAYMGCDQEGVCILCGVKRIFFDDRLTWEMAHVKSHSEGGDSELSNIRPICFTCNRSMGSKHFMTFLIERYPERYHLVINRLKLV